MKKILSFISALACFSCFAQVKIEDFGGACNGVSDNTPALNAAVSALQFASNRTIVFPHGVCAFYSSPAIIRGGIHLQGQGINNTTLRRMFNTANFIQIRGSGARVSNLLIEANSGTSKGVGLFLDCDATNDSCGLHVIENVKISGNAIGGAWGTWDYPLLLSGTAKSSQPQGLRTVHMRFVQAFNGTWVGAQMWDCVACDWFGGGVYQGGGTTQRVQIGGALAVANRIDAHIDWAASSVQSGSLR